MMTKEQKVIQNNDLEVLDDSLLWFLIDKNIQSQIVWLMMEFQLMSMIHTKQKNRL